MKIIPAIDLQGGKCVRLCRGDFEQITEYSDDPASVARQFGALETTDLHVVDLDGARSGIQSNRVLIGDIAAISNLTIQIGGGIRDRGILERWLDAGVSRCVIGSLALTEPDTVREWLSRVGTDRIVLALDVTLESRAIPMITTHGWTRVSDTSLYDCIDDFVAHGLRHLLCTDVSRDGAMSGPNFALYAQIVARYPDLQLQASGGVRNLADLEELRRLGVPAAITGRALLDGRISAAEIRSFRQSA